MILIPGIISSGLESWSTKPEAAPFFRKRIWASTTMLRAIISSKDTWVAAMSLDPETGLDQGGYKVRAAQGADEFRRLGGYAAQADLSLGNDRA